MKPFAKLITRFVEGYSAVGFLQLGRAGALAWEVLFTAGIFF